MIKAIAFDFDGVFILDSDAVFKPEAWPHAFQNYSGYGSVLEDAKTLYSYGKRGGRVEIIRHVLEKLKVPPEELNARVAHVSQCFDDIVQARISEAGLVPGAREVLELLNAKTISLYLNSGTATAALVCSVKNLGIAEFFTGIFGSTCEPVGGSKVENLSYISSKDNIRREQILMVGDGESDVIAAYEFGCSFIGVANKWNNWGDKNNSYPCVTDLRDILNYL